MRGRRPAPRARPSALGLALGLALAAGLVRPSLAAEVPVAPEAEPPPLRLRCQEGRLYLSPPVGADTPSAPSEAGLGLPDGTRCVQASAGPPQQPTWTRLGPVLYVGLRPTGILLVDAVRPEAPHVLRVLPTDSPVTSLRTSGSELLAELEDGPMLTYKASDPYRPRLDRRPAPPDAFVHVTLVGDRVPLSLRVREPSSQEGQMHLKNQEESGRFVSQVRLLKDPRYVYFVSARGMREEVLRAPAEDGTEIRISPRAGLRQGGGVAMLIVGGVGAVVGVSLLVVPAITLGPSGAVGKPAAEIPTPFLVGGIGSLVGGGVLMGVGGFFIAKGDKILTIPPGDR